MASETARIQIRLQCWKKTIGPALRPDAFATSITPAQNAPAVKQVDANAHAPIFTNVSNVEVLVRVEYPRLRLPTSKWIHGQNVRLAVSVSGTQQDSIALAVKKWVAHAARKTKTSALPVVTQITVAGRKTSLVPAEPACLRLARKIRKLVASQHSRH